MVLQQLLIKYWRCKAHSITLKSLFSIFFGLGARQSMEIDRDSLAAVDKILPLMQSIFGSKESQRVFRRENKAEFCRIYKSAITAKEHNIVF